jgi:hypothetical protein
VVSGRVLKIGTQAGSIMAENEMKVKCPFCEGQAELTPSEIAKRFTTPELRKRLDARIAEILEDHHLAGVATGPRVRDFEKEVHTWNPTLPMWQRSPKE